MCRWTLVAILWMVLCCSSAENCAKVYKTARFCVSEADKAIVLSCPPRHAIEIKHAELRTVRPDAICSPMEDLSLAGNTTQDVGVCGTAMNVKPEFRLCSILSTCSTTLATLQDDCNYSPNAQVEIKYGCMAKFGIPNMDIAFAMPMTRDHEWRGSMAQIDSHYQALNGTFINTIDTKCAIAVPSGTEFKLNMALSLFRGPGSSRCNQHILVQKNGSDESWEFCSGNSPHVMLPCDDQEQHFYVSFVTGDIRARAVFVFYARVHHDKDLKIVCGQDANWMFDGPQFRPVIDETTTSTPPEDKEDDDTLNEQKNSEDFQHGELTENDNMDMMPIVVGCVAAAVVIMIVVLLIIFINYRKSPEYLDEKSSVTSSESGSNIAKLGNVYVDGEIKSKLMIGKNLTSLQKLGFQLPMQA